MTNETATAETIGDIVHRECDALRKGWKQVLGDWKLWPKTLSALQECYYVQTFPQADQAYALAGLQQFRTAWTIEHAHRETEQRFLDEACAHEVRYHANRGRLFRRPCAALSTCWRAIISERPERVLDRVDRDRLKKRKEAKKPF